MKTLKDIDICTHTNPSDCKYYIYLVYKTCGAVLQLPNGHDTCPCDHCQWLNRNEDFYSLTD